MGPLLWTVRINVDGEPNGSGIVFPGRLDRVKYPCEEMLLLHPGAQTPIANSASLRFLVLVVAVVAACLIPNSTSMAATPIPTSTTRPFAAPVTTQTVNVPSSIDATGNSDVAAALQAFVNSVPNGSVISFPTNGIYRVSVGIRLDNRSNLVFAGNGSTIRTTGSGNNTLASPFVLGWFTGNSHIWIKGFTLEGNNPHTGTDIYDGANENQMGVDLNGSAWVEISNNTIRKTWGDAVYANATTSTGQWPTDIWVHDNSFDYIGRNAFTINSGRRVTLERNAIDHVGGSVLDIEPDSSTQGAIDLALRDNTVGVWGWSPQYTMHFVACANNNAGPGAIIRGITVTGNYVSQGAPNSANTPNAGGLSTLIAKSRTSDVTFTNNTTTKTGGGPVLRFEHVDGLTVQGNVQPLTSGSLTYIYDATGVSQN